MALRAVELDQPGLCSGLPLWHWGDFDQNDIFTLSDADALVAAITAGSADLAFDINGDDLVTAADYLVWRGLAAYFTLGSGHTYLPGDADLTATLTRPTTRSGGSSLARRSCLSRALTEMGTASLTRPTTSYGESTWEAARPRALPAAQVFRSRRALCCFALPRRLLSPSGEEGVAAARLERSWRLKACLISE